MSQPEIDILVAGSGIAGLTAALTAARLGRRTLVVTGDVLGGQLLSINEIDGLPGFEGVIAGYDLCPITQDQAVAAGAEFATGEVAALEFRDGVWHARSGDGQTYLARSAVLATGAALKPLGVPGEDRLAGKGVSQCASCDAPLMKGRIVAVIGGGDSAAQEALTLAESVERVLIIHRGERLSAQAAYRSKLEQHPKIELIFGTIVDEILGEDGVTGIRLRDLASGATATRDVAGVFPFVGMRPNTGFLNELLALDFEGRVPTDAAMRTSIAGLAAAGALRSGWPGRAAASAGEGAAAAIALDRYLSDDRW
jgi:thioredoxin reductase (NADPH)